LALRTRGIAAAVWRKGRWIDRVETGEGAGKANVLVRGQADKKVMAKDLLGPMAGKGRGASVDVVRYMVEALPQSLQTADSEGNLPLHYAAMYSGAAVVKLMADNSSDACQHANNRIRLPLYLVCARIWDQDSLALSMIMNIKRHNPVAFRLSERQGRYSFRIALL
jgi:hypothetical protein